MEDRPKRRCTGCGEVRELATKELCFRCYRRLERTRTEQVKRLRLWGIITAQLVQAGLGAEEVREVQKILYPHFREVGEYLQPRIEPVGITVDTYARLDVRLIQDLANLPRARRSWPGCCSSSRRQRSDSSVRSAAWAATSPW